MKFKHWHFCNAENRNVFQTTSQVHRCCGWQPVFKEDRGMNKDNYWIIKKLAYLEEDVASCDRISAGRYLTGNKLAVENKVY